MKRLFTLIVLLAFTAGMIGCAPQTEDSTAVPADTNAPAAPAEQPAATTNQ